MLLVDDAPLKPTHSVRSRGESAIPGVANGGGQGGRRGAAPDGDAGGVVDGRDDVVDGMNVVYRCDGRKDLAVIMELSEDSGLERN